jgi:hypothetical protein
LHEPIWQWHIYIGHVGYFDCELAMDIEGEYDDGDAKDDNPAEAEYEASSNNHVQDGDSGHDNGNSVWDLEI